MTDRTLKALRSYDDSLPKSVEEALERYEFEVECDCYNPSSDAFQKIVETIQQQFMEGSTHLFEAFECVAQRNYGLASDYLRKTFEDNRKVVVAEMVEDEQQRLMNEYYLEGEES